MSNKQRSFISGLMIWVSVSLIDQFSLSKDLISLGSRTNYSTKGYKDKYIQINIYIVKKKILHQLKLISGSKAENMIRITISGIILKL